MNAQMNEQLCNLFISIREGDNQLVYLSDCIKELLVAARESGVSRDSALKSLKKWNTNTEDGSEIRSQSILNRWLRDSGFESTNKDGAKRKERSGTVKASSKDKALAKIKAMMEEHGITVADLA